MARKPIDQKVVDAILADRQAGMALRETAIRHGVSEATVRRYQRAASDGVVPRPAPSAPPEKTDLHDRLVELADNMRRNRLFDLAATVSEAAEIVREHAALEACGDVLESTRLLVAQNRAAYQRCVDLNLETQAQRYSRTIATLTPVLARLEREKLGDDGAIVIQAGELEQARESFLEKLAVLASRPLTCAECGARLRMRETVLAVKARNVRLSEDDETETEAGTGRLV